VIKKDYSLMINFMSSRANSSGLIRASRKLDNFDHSSGILVVKRFPSPHAEAHILNLSQPFAGHLHSPDMHVIAIMYKLSKSPRTDADLGKISPDDSSIKARGHHFAFPE